MGKTQSKLDALLGQTECLMDQQLRLVERLAALDTKVDNLTKLVVEVIRHSMDSQVQMLMVAKGKSTEAAQHRAMGRYVEPDEEWEEQSESDPFGPETEHTIVHLREGVTPGGDPGFTD